MTGSDEYASTAGEAGWPKWLAGRASTAGGHDYTRGLKMTSVIEGETTIWKRLTLEKKVFVGVRV